jgi:hypothetical protein
MLTSVSIHLRLTVLRQVYRAAGHDDAAELMQQFYAHAQAVDIPEVRRPARTIPRWHGR